MDDERLRTLLYNALVLLEEGYGIDNTLVSLEDTPLLEDLDMSKDEYNELMQH